VIRPPDSGSVALSIRELASRLRYPLLKDAVFDAVGVDTRQIYPHHPRDLHRGDAIRMFGRYLPARDGPMVVEITGMNNGDAAAFLLNLDLDDAERSTVDLARDWATAKLHHLYSASLRFTGETAERLRGEIDRLIERYPLDRD